MRILFLISYYKVGDGASAGLYSLISGDPKMTDYLVLSRWNICSQKGLKIKRVSTVDEIVETLKNGNFDLIHYFKASFSNLFELVIHAMRSLHLDIPILATVCQRPSYPNLLLSPFEIRYTSHFIFIDKTSYNDPLIRFIPAERKTMIYCAGNKSQKITEGIEPKKNINGVIIYGRGSSFSKCPRNMFEVFDKIEIPNKRFCVVGIPEGDNWVRREAAKRSNVYVYPLLPYNEWFELCKTFDVSLYQIPTDSHASLDANLGLPMLMQKPTVYYGSEAPKERLIHGVNAFIANTYDEIVKYATILGKDSDLRRKMGQAARQTNLEMFSFQKRLDEHYKIYELLLREREKLRTIRVPLYYKIIFLIKSYKTVIRSLLHWYPNRIS
jgi:glycosyltransferase involved in cell wall biosynthesis